MRLREHNLSCGLVRVKNAAAQRLGNAMPHDVLYRYTRRDLRHALKRGDLTIFDAVLHFLEDDPKTFGSGYMKTDMWRSIRRYRLDASHIACLEQAALKSFQRPMAREFKPMCHTLAEIGTPEFWSRVADKMTSDRPIEQLNARCLHAYSNGLMAGERQRRETLRRFRDE